MLGSVFSQLRGLPVYSDIGARVLANYQQLARDWPPGSAYGLPDLATYLGMQETERLKAPGKVIGYDEFRDLYKASKILFYKSNPANVDTASMGVLFLEREHMRKTIDESSGNLMAYKKAFAAYGTLCRLDDADYAYARLADLPDKNGHYMQSMRIASETPGRVTFACAPFDPCFMPAYLAAEKEVSMEIAALKEKPVSSWRVPNTGRQPL